MAMRKNAKVILKRGENYLGEQSAMVKSTFQMNSAYAAY